MRPLTKILLRKRILQGNISSAAKSEEQFEDYRKAFAAKSLPEIWRSLAVLRICSFQYFVNHSEKLFEKSQKIPLVSSLAHQLVKVSFYNQFVGGESDQEIEDIVRKLDRSRVKPILVCTMEEDVGQASCVQEDLYDRNLTRVLDCLTLAAKVSTRAPCVQLKMTSLFSADTLERLSSQYSFLEPSRKLSWVESAAQSMHHKKAFSIPGLTREDRQHLERGVERLQAIGEVVERGEMRLLVDGEFTYVNPAMALLCLAMQAEVNRTLPRIWNTYQCYLKAAPEAIAEDLEFSKSLGVCFGAKLVRGAYITAEEKWALKKGTPMPVCDTYTDTNNNYNRCLEMMVQYATEFGSRFGFVAATHNEDSIRLLIRRMKDEGMQENDARITFAQLYGMSDQVTFTLGSSSYNVYKSIPVGPLHEAIPYLARRATENQSVLAGARKEQRMLAKALMHRMTHLRNAQ